MSPQPPLSRRIASFIDAEATTSCGNSTTVNSAADMPKVPLTAGAPTPLQPQPKSNQQRLQRRSHDPLTPHGGPLHQEDSGDVALGAFPLFSPANKKTVARFVPRRIVDGRSRLKN